MDIYSIIGDEIVPSMTPVVVLTEIEVIVGPPDKYKLFSCNTQWAAPGYRFTLDGEEYEVESFVQNEYLIVTGAVEPTVLFFQLSAPYFEYGNSRKVNIERNQQGDKTQLTPLIYMMLVRNTGAETVFSPYGFEGRPRIFFLEGFDRVEEDIDSHKTNVIKPMRAMMKLFRDKIDDRQDLFDDVENAQDFDWMDFGSPAIWGNNERIFDELLSGVELQMDLKAFTQPDNCCTDTPAETCLPVPIIGNDTLMVYAPSGDSYEFEIRNFSGDLVGTWDANLNVWTVPDGGGAIDIEINDNPFLSGVTVDTNIEVVGTDSLPKGAQVSGKWRIADASVILNGVPFATIPAEAFADYEIKDITGTNYVGSKVGAQWRIGNSTAHIKNTLGDELLTANLGAEQSSDFIVGDCEQTFNTSPVASQPAETTKEIIVQTQDAAPTGSVLTDTPSQLIIEVENSTVNVNGDAFESVAPGSILDVPVLDTSSNPVGTNLGPSIEIADSDVSANGNLLTPIRSQQAKTINIIDAIDADPVALNIVTDTESLAEIVVPNGLVNVKNSAGTTLYPVTVKSGGTANQVVADTTANAKNTAGTVLATGAVVAGVTKDLTVPNINLTQPNGGIESKLAGIGLSCTQIAALINSDLISQLTDAQVQAVYEGRINVNVVQYTSPGAVTYNKPANLLYAHVICVGGGGGGSGGSRQPLGTAAGGGGGGGAGSLQRMVLANTDIAAGVTVTVGGGGAGGAGRNTNGTQNGGTAGGSSSFGSTVVAVGGNPGVGGGVTAGGNTSNMAWTPVGIKLGSTGGGGGPGGTTVGGSSGGVAATVSGFIGFGGGGGGAGIAIAGTGGNGGSGSRHYNSAATLNAAATGGPGSTIGNATAGGNGVDNWSLQISIRETNAPIGYGTGGGGGGSSTFATGNGGNGGNGGIYGAGGGGGGACMGGTSGSGGNGSDGCVLIVEFLV